MGVLSTCRTGRDGCSGMGYGYRWRGRVFQTWFAVCRDWLDRRLIPGGRTSAPSITFTAHGERHKSLQVWSYSTTPTTLHRWMTTAQILWQWLEVACAHMLTPACMHVWRSSIYVIVAIVAIIAIVAAASIDSVRGQMIGMPSAPFIGNILT